MLPSIGYRFYSSTDYFSIPPCTTGQWYDLSLKNWESLETELTERIDQAVASASAALPGDGEDAEDGGKNISRTEQRRGPRSAGDGMARVFEEVATLFPWDRPQLYSPVKGEEGKANMGNSVFLLTRLPTDMAGVNNYLGLPITKRPTNRDMEVVIGKKMRELCNGELGLKLHFLDTASLQGGCGTDPDVLNLFSKVLKQPRGGVLPLASLTMSGLPTSALLAAHLKSLPLPPRSMEAKFTPTSLPLLPALETNLNLLACDLSRFQLKCATPLSTFPVSQTWESSTTLWSPPGNSGSLCPILSFLEHSGLAILYQDRESSKLGVLSPHSPTAATFGVLSVLDSHFFSLILRLTHPRSSNIELPPSVLSSLPSLPELSRTPVEEVKPAPPQPSSTSSWLLERWLLPTTAPSPLLSAMLQRKGASQDLHSNVHRNMLKVRETLLASSLPGVAPKKDMRSLVLERKRSGEARTALNRKESEISATSTGSRASSGGSFGSKREAKGEAGKKSLSRAARLRQLGEARGSLGGEVRINRVLERYLITTLNTRLRRKKREKVLPW